MLSETFFKFFRWDANAPAPVKITRLAYIWSYILYTPFWSIYNLLPFILFKDLQASPFAIATLITLKPVVSIFSLYWSSHVVRRRDRLKLNIILAGILGNLPFFLYPFLDKVWFFVASAALFMLLARGVVPAWMELLKLNLPDESRHKAFAYGSAICYFISGLFPILFGWLMDHHAQAWRWIFPATALISLSTILLQLRIPVPKDENPIQTDSTPLLEHILKPWKNAWQLLLQRRDFAYFQLGFMICGFGVMLWQPALPAFFMGTLNLSYTELATAMTFCKGIGYALASPVCANYFNRATIFKFCGYVALLFALFPLLLIAAQINMTWLFAAYLLYGMTQSASEMCWSLSGPAFAFDKEDSTVYSSINVLSVGLRGCIAPPLGGYLLSLGGAMVDITLGCAFCLAATAYLFVFARRFTPAATSV
jgi:MFS family permease